MPGFPFPRVGPWVHGSPPSPSGSSRMLGTMVSYDCHSLVSVASLLTRAPIPDRLSSVCVPRAAYCPVRFVGQEERPFQHQGSWSTGTPSLPVAVDQETSGSPEFPNCPHEPMPRSQTPVVSCALAFGVPRTAAFCFLESIGFGTRSSTPYPLDHHEHGFRSSMTRPGFLRPPVSDVPYGLDPWSLLLTCWLGFGQVGLEAQAWRIRA